MAQSLRRRRAGDRRGSSTGCGRRSVLVVADTSGLLAAFDRDSADSSTCEQVLREAGTVVVSPMILTELDHLTRSRFGGSQRAVVMNFVLAQVDRMRFLVPGTGREVLGIARDVQQRYAGLDLDLTDAVNVALAAEFRTTDILTLDRRDFRAIRPLVGAEAFRLLPDDS
ncbi:PIN domain-containing protein [Nocardia sp. CA-290969]|uniref:PIN domain-containing protein n=1 Tax=Nocardia sp. CA-290969 TaxID=3239986 RepID=UPI003D8E823C